MKLESNAFWKAKTRRPLLFGALFLSLANPLSASALAQSAAQLEAGAPLTLELLAPVASNRNRAGDTVNFRVKEAVLAPDGRVLIAQGAPATGRVTRAKRAGYFGSKGKLDIALDFVTAADGQKIGLRGERNLDGNNRRGLVLSSVLLLTTFGLLFKGGNASVPQGQSFTVFTAQATTLSFSDDSNANAGGVR